VRLNYNYGTKIRKEDRNKISPDIILEAIRAVKISQYIIYLSDKPH